MRPSIVNYNLHLIYEAMWPRFAAIMVFLFPLFQSLTDSPLLEPYGSHPTSDAVPPEANKSVVE